MRLIFICSPYKGDVPANTEIAKKMCLKAIECGFAPYAPHLFFPRFLQDSEKSQRCCGMNAGLAWLQASDEIWIYTGKGISSGMQIEIDHAKELGKPIVEFAEI